MRTVSILGATGFVGGRLLATLRERAAGRLAAGGAGRRPSADPAVVSLDLTDRAALAAHLERDFDAVVVAAGTKDVERCERDPGHALALNTAPVEELVRIVARRGLRTRLVLLSTDY